MTRAELREFLYAKWFCGCGDPEAAAVALTTLLRLHPLYESENRAQLDELVPNEGVRYLVLYGLDQAGLTEHGTVVDGAWLTPKGAEVLAALEEASGDLEAVFDG